MGHHLVVASGHKPFVFFLGACLICSLFYLGESEELAEDWDSVKIVVATCGPSCLYE